MTRVPARPTSPRARAGVWERLRYDWSDPPPDHHDDHRLQRVRRPFGHTYTLTQRPGGRTDVDAVVVCEGKNLKGRLLAIALGTGGKRVLAKSLGKTVKAIEARNFQAKAADLK